jgi:hypothetical protein
MASSITLAQLRADARLYADQREAGAGPTIFISDIELNRLVNLKIRELYDLLVEARGGDYYATESTIAIVPGTARYPLPADFYQLLSVTLEWAPQRFELLWPVGTMRQRVPLQNWVQWSERDPKGYKLRASQIEFLPMPTSAVQCRLQHVPAAADLIADGDTFDGINGWEKMCAVGVALEMLAIEKRSNGKLEAAYAEQVTRIETMKSERDAEAAKEVVDVNPEGHRYRSAFFRIFDETFDGYFG